jgi:hypothetical protein
MSSAATASINRRCESKKRKFVSSSFRQTKYQARAGLVAASELDFDRRNTVRKNRTAPVAKARTYRRPSATPKSTGFSAVALQSQLPLSVF